MRARLHIAAAALILWFPTVAGAQQCMDTTASWTTPYPQGNIQAITYFVWQQPPPPPVKRPPVLAVLYRTGELHLHVNVPQATAQAFISLVSADQRYAATVQNRFTQAMLSEGLCPLLAEDDNYLLGQQP